MQVALENNIVFVVIEYLAILCWGLSGGLAAIRKGYDIFTIMLCGWLTALGGGLVRDAGLYPQVETKIRALCAEAGLTVRDYFDSPILGGDGNREFFVCAVRE